MSLIQNISLRQKPSLTMTTQLRQAISLLQMNNFQLLDYLSKEVEENPLLELVIGKTGQPFDFRTKGINHNLPETDFDPVQNIASKKTLNEVLVEQISMSERSCLRSRLAIALAGELDENGYLLTPLFEMAERLGASQCDMESALELLQSCEPAGIAARDLRECLTIQLKDQGRYDFSMQIITDNLQAVANSDLDRLGNLTRLSADDLASAIVRLKSLNPRPASRFADSEVQTVIPEVVVTKSHLGGWRAELNDEALPRLVFNYQYADRISGTKPTALGYVRKYSASGKFLLRTLDQRAKTILNVANFIVRYQAGFFSYGTCGLRPLTLAIIAEDLGIHESTVSRVANGKYLSCHRGIFKFGYFLVQGVNGVNSGKEIALPLVQQKIRQLIAGEASIAALSDEKITIILKDQGIDIARRTVAKYRKAMGIPSSSRRQKNADVTGGE